MMWGHRSPSGGVGRAVFIGVIVVVGSTLAGRRAGAARPLDWLAYLLLLASCASLVVRRRFPEAVLAATLVVAVVYPHLGYASDTGLFILPLMAALFAAMSVGKRLAAVVVAILYLAAFLAFGVLGGNAPPQALPWVPGWLAAALVAGEVARARRDFMGEARRRMIEAERTREEEARRRATEERLRIAREVHDVLSHSISMINVQAGVAVHLLDTQPEQARTALVAIKQASKDALRDLRSTLGVLRDVNGDDDSPRSPAPSLERLDELVASASAAGVTLTVSVHGQRRELPSGVDMAAYRIAQESVSNIVRHAGQTAGTITVRYSPDDLSIQIDNDGGAVHLNGETAGGGNGILGMRERATALGGELEAGPRPTGGFRVLARLPFGSSK